ncbi:MAG: hypothetical protein ACLQVA_07330 [Candidatus Brocadiia bacterium]
MGILLSILSRYRYVLLSAVVAALMLVHTSKQVWTGDFWEHAAVVRELATNPVSPHHPQILSDAPHPFYSPYTVLAGCISRATGIDCFRTLALLGMVNLALLLISLWMFSVALLKHREAAFYVLLFTLVLWGPTAWMYSGFFHLHVLGDVLPYPSTFATAIALLGSAIYCKVLRTGNRLALIPVALASLVVAITHPPTFIFFSVCILSLTLGIPAGRLPLREYARLLACIFILPLIVAMFWPYYPFFQLLAQDSSLYHAGNVSMYTDVVRCIWPAFPGIPLIIWRFKSKKTDPVFLIAAVLSLIYAYGALSHHWTYGRVISYIVLMLHMSIADVVARVEISLRARLQSPASVILAFAGLAAVVLAAFLCRATIRSLLVRGLRLHEVSTYQQYKSLSGATPQYDVVLSDLATSWFVPAFAGKVVAVPRPLPFVPDGAARRNDVERFFSESALQTEREAIIRKYNVKWLLLNKENVPQWATIEQSFRDQAEITLSNDQFILMHLR